MEEAGVDSREKGLTCLRRKKAAWLTMGPDRVLDVAKVETLSEHGGGARRRRSILSLMPTVTAPRSEEAVYQAVTHVYVLRMVQYRILGRMSHWACVGALLPPTRTAERTNSRLRL